MRRARLRPGLLALGLLAGVALAAGCQDVGGTVQLGVRDQAVYAREVHAVIEARCGTLDCHGDARRPLRIYAETGLRLRDELRGQPLTPEELATVCTGTNEENLPFTRSGSTRFATWDNGGASLLISF